MASFSSSVSPCSFACATSCIWSNSSCVTDSASLPCRCDISFLISSLLWSSVSALRSAAAFSSLRRAISSLSSRTVISLTSCVSMTSAATSSGAAKSAQTLEIPISVNVSVFEKRLLSSSTLSASFIIFSALLFENSRLSAHQLSNCPCGILPLISMRRLPASASIMALMFASPSAWWYLTLTSAASCSVLLFSRLTSV